MKIRIEISIFRIVERLMNIENGTLNGMEKFVWMMSGMIAAVQLPIFLIMYTF